MTIYGGSILAEDNSTSSITTGAVNVTGIDRALAVAVTCDTSGAPAPGVGDVSWDVATPETMDGLANSELNIGDFLYSFLFYLDDPTAANDTVTVDLGGVTVDNIGCVVAFFTEAADIVGTDEDSESITAGTALSVTVPNVVSGDMVFDMASWDDPTGAATEGDDQTLRDDSGAAGLGNYLRMATSTQAGADGGVMSWTVPNVAYYASLLALRIPTAAAGDVLQPQIWM